jgi:hypothetical protein
VSVAAIGSSQSGNTLMRSQDSWSRYLNWMAAPARACAGR